MKCDLIVYIEADIYGISLFGVIRVTGIHIAFVSAIIYNVHDYSVLYNDTVGPIICEGWSLTRMWKAPALPDNTTQRMI